MVHARSVVVLVLALVAGLGAAVQVPAAPRGANRDLERVLERSSFLEPDVAQIGRAFRVALDAGVAEREALALVESCVGGEFRAEQVVRVLTIAAQLTLENVPPGLFISKVREGVAKRVEAGRIVQAAEQRALALKQATNILKQLALEGLSASDRAELLPDVAEALASGMDQGRIREIVGGAAREGDSPGAIRRKLFP